MVTGKTVKSYGETNVSTSTQVSEVDTLAERDNALWVLFTSTEINSPLSSLRPALSLRDCQFIDKVRIVANGGKGGNGCISLEGDMRGFISATLFKLREGVPAYSKTSSLNMVCVAHVVITIVVYPAQYVDHG